MRRRFSATTILPTATDARRTAASEPGRGEGWSVWHRAAGRRPAERCATDGASRGCQTRNPEPRPTASLPCSKRPRGRCRVSAAPGNIGKERTPAGAAEAGAAGAGATVGDANERSLTDAPAGGAHRRAGGRAYARPEGTPCATFEMDSLPPCVCPEAHQPWQHRRPAFKTGAKPALHRF